LTQSVSQNTTTPLITLGGSQTITCTNTTAVLTGSSTTNPANYSWTGPSSGVPAGSTPTNSNTTVSAGGNYTLTLTNPVNTCTTSAVVAIIQNTATPVATSTVSGALNCTLTTVNASATTTTSPVSYTWSGSGITSSTNTNSITANQSGTFNYTVTNTTTGCFVVGSQAVSINTTVPTSTLTPSSLTTTCASPTATLLVTSSADPNAVYTWTVPSSGSLSNTGISNPTASGSGVFTVAVTNTLNGCTSALQTVTITADANTPVLMATSINSIICSGSTTTLSVTGANTYTWTSDAGSVTTSTAVVSPTTTTTYSVIGTNSLTGCSNVTNVTVNVNTTPTVGISSSATDVCEGESATITLTGASSYTLTNPSVITTNSIIVTPTIATTYTVNGESANCVSTTQTISIGVNVLPTLNATANNTTICEGNTSVLNVTGADTYSWSTMETVGSITVTPTDTMTYTVVGTNTLSGCTNTTNVTINVNPTPTVNITASSMAICEGNTATITLTGATNYTITNPAQTTTGTIVVTPTTQTTYTVTGESLGCNSVTQTMTIDVNPLPQIAVANATTCAGTAVTLTANNADTYNWMPTGTSGNTLSVIPTGNTTYSVTGTNTLTGCTSTITTADVTVNQLPTVAASANPGTTCTSGTVNLNTTTAATSYTWTLGNGIDITNQNQSIPSFPAITLSSVTYIYTVTVTSADNCLSIPATATLNIIDLPNADFDLSDLSICQNDNGTISINAPQTGVNYDWNINGQTITNTNPLTVPATVSSAAGIYTVSVIAGVGSCTNTAANTLTVNSLPIVTLVDPTVSACENAGTHLDVATPNSNYNYNWTYNNQVVGTGPTLNIDPLTQSNAGNYTVTVTDTNGCNNRTIGAVDAQTCDVFIPEIFTPNGDGKNDGFVIRNIENYPDNKLKIFNRWGNLIYQKDSYLNEFEGYANTGDAAGKEKLPAGTYYVILEYGDNKTETYNGFLLLQY
jgi:gliding motility-associated-like protein